MKINKNFWIFSVVMLLNTVITFAQTFDDAAEDADKNFTPVGPEPPPQADINQFLMFGVILAIVLGFVYFYNNRKLQNTSDINL